jgi:integrase
MRLNDEYTQWLRSKGKSNSTIEQYTHHLKPLKTISYKGLRAFMDDPKRSNQYITVYAFRSFVRYLRRIKKLTPNQKALLLDDYQYEGTNDGTRRKKIAFPHTQWKDLIKQAPHRQAKMAIWLGLNFGLRRGEIVHLRVQDVDLESQTLYITGYNRTDEWRPKTKTSEREFALNEHQFTVLSKWLAARPTLTHPYLLWNQWGNKVTARTFHTWCEKMNLRSHDLRRSFGTYLYIQSKKDIVLVKNALGHSNIKVTSKYLLPDKEETKRRIAALTSH